MEKKDILEDRAFVEIHMMQSIDGKATGDFSENQIVGLV